MNYSIKKNELEIISGKTDLCAELNKIPSGMADIMSVLGIPSRCPVDVVRIKYKSSFL